MGKTYLKQTSKPTNHKPIKQKTEGSCVKKHLKTHTCQALRNLRPKEQTGRRLKCQQCHGGSQDMEDSRTQSTGPPEDREKEHTMKQRRGRHQKASGYWRGEEGSRWIFKVYDSGNLCLSIWITHQRGNFLQIFWGFPIPNCIAIILFRALLNEIWEIF